MIYTVPSNVIDAVIKNTFTFNKNKLPTIKFLKKFIQTDTDWKFNNRFYWVFSFRELYISNNFTILSHDFLLSIKNMVNDLKIQTVVELSCGLGWFSYWMKKYDVPIIDSIDNKSWSKYKLDDYLDFVSKKESVRYVKNHPNIQLFVLSWPYMDNIAVRIWKSMRANQYLLYIGESEGGCTASDQFFRLTYDHLIKDEWNLYNNCLSFWGVHDKPYLFKK